MRELLYVREREMVDDAMDADKGEQTTLGAAGGAATRRSGRECYTKRKIEVKKMERRRGVVVEHLVRFVRDL